MDEPGTASRLAAHAHLTHTHEPDVGLVSFTSSSGVFFFRTPAPVLPLHPTASPIVLPVTHFTLPEDIVSGRVDVPDTLDITGVSATGTCASCRPRTDPRDRRRRARDLARTHIAASAGMHRTGQPASSHPHRVDRDRLDGVWPQRTSEAAHTHMRRVAERTDTPDVTAACAVQRGRQHTTHHAPASPSLAQDISGLASLGGAVVPSTH